MADEGAPVMDGHGRQGLLRQIREGVADKGAVDKGVATKEITQ